MSYDKNKLGRLLKAICDHTVPAPVDHTNVVRYRVIGGAGSAISVESVGRKTFFGKMPSDGAPTLYVLDEGCSAFDEFVDELLHDEEMASLIGEAAIRNQIDGVLRDLNGIFPSDQDDPALFVRMKVLKPLREKLTDWHVYVPLENLQVRETLNIGDVQVVKYDGGLPITTYTSGRFAKTSEGVWQDDTGKKLPADIIDTAKAFECWAVTTVRAHKKNLSVAVRRKVGRAVNLVRAFTHVLFPRSNRCLFDMAGFVSPGTFVVLGRDDPGNLQTHSEAVGYLAPFDLTEERLRYLRQEWHFDKLCEIVGTSGEQQNTLAKSIAVASYWLGQAAVASTLEDECVRVTIALERLLICDSEETTTERVAVRLALLVADEYAERVAVQVESKRLYDIRSRIVHAGFIGVTEDEVTTMGNFALRALKCCLDLTDTITSQEELKALLNRRMLD